MDAVEVNGLRLACRRAGQGPAVVFVHGGAEDSRTWAAQLEALADEFTVIAWDEPGAGESDDIPATFTLADYADCLAGLVRVVSADPVCLVGLSWGTTVVLELYRRHPKVVRSMVLADAYAGWLGSLGPAEAAARLAAVRRAVGEPDGQGDPTPGLFAGTTPAHAVDLLAAMAADVRPASLLVAATAMAQADLSDVLPQVAVPVQLVWGALDARSPLAVAHEFERRIPHAGLAVIPDCGHCSHLEDPTAFTDVVRRFLRARG